MEDGTALQTTSLKIKWFKLQLSFSEWTQWGTWTLCSISCNATTSLGFRERERNCSLVSNNTIVVEDYLCMENYLDPSGPNQTQACGDWPCVEGI